MIEPTYRPLTVAMLAAASLGVPSWGQAAPIQLADNSQVLQAWQEGGGAAPSLVEQADGGTVIQWTAGVSLDAYHNNVSGVTKVTPLRDGGFFKATVQGDVRGTGSGGDLRYLQFSATGTDDKAVLGHAAGTQINTLHVGLAGTGYQVALGDVAAGFSSLGTNLGLRGVLAQRQFGRTLVSATAGAVAESWEALADVVDRTRQLRNVYAAKVETPVWETGKVYATLQGYDDDRDSLPSSGTSLNPASARTVTAGFAYQKDRFTVQGEAGVSNWKESGGQDEDDRALIVDASWQFQTAGLRAGHHDIGKYYSSLAAQGGNGVEETYLNGNWLATNWLNLNADLRRSRNALAGTPVITVPPTPPSTNATETDAFAAGATITFGPDHPGWSLLLNHARSQGESSGGLAVDNRSHGATVAYAGQDWNGSVAYLSGTVENGAAPAYDADTATWQLTLGKNWSDASLAGSPTWTLGVNLGLSRQEQELKSGGGPETTTWQVGLNGQRAGWGVLAASYLDGTTKGQPGGGDLRQRTWQLEATHPLSGQNAVKLYLRDNRRSGSTSGADYDENVVGVQLVYVH